MLTAQEARRSQKETFTLRGRVIDAINSTVKSNESEVTIKGLHLSEELSRELENKGYFVNGNVISWYEMESKEELQEALAERVSLSPEAEVEATSGVIGDMPDPNKEEK